MGHGLHVLAERSLHHATASSGARESLRCSCPDFTDYRTRFDMDDPRRLCRHLVSQMLEGDTLPEEFREYREELDRVAKKLKGFYPYSHRESTTILGKKFTVFGDDYDENSDVYEVLIFLDGKRYAYEPDDGKWAKNVFPRYRAEIERRITHMLEGFQPPPLPECSIRTIYRDEGKTSYHIRGEFVEGERGKRLRGEMKHDSEIFEVFAGPVDRESCALEYHVMSGDCIVSPRLKYMERAIRRWLEDEYPNPREDYLWGGF
jgi:hypothetical protein